MLIRIHGNTHAIDLNRDQRWLIRNAYRQTRKQLCKSKIVSRWYVSHILLDITEGQTP